MKIKKLSRGLRQKVGIASVIIDEPDLLILDEPVSALDPIGRKEMFDIILALKGEVTIIFSSHIFTDVERVCDHIILLSKGNIILDSKIEDIAIEKQILLIGLKDKEDCFKIKENLGYTCNFSERIENCLEIYNEDIKKLQKDVFSFLNKHKLFVNFVSVKKDSLEEIFLREVKRNG